MLSSSLEKDLRVSGGKINIIKEPERHTAKKVVNLQNVANGDTDVANASC